MSTRPTMRILYGPPGTGKTWLAAREAVATVEPVSYESWRSGVMTDTELLALHHRLVLQGRIKWVTFHPSYTYEDFVEGFRPVATAHGANISFEVRKGPFRQICDLASGFASSFGPPVGAEISAIGGSKTYEVIGANDQGWLLRVRPNRTDQVGDAQEKFVTRRMIESAVALDLEPRVFSIPGKSTVDPADYGLDGEPMVGAELRRTVGEMLGISSSDLANSAHVAAVLKYVKDDAAAPPEPTPACLVIDEINRADLSRVFGELITLLEPDKRIGAPEERRVHLPYSGEERFGIPPTLSVIGTMNTADRSISTMDFAMRRRFSFTEVAPDPALCPLDHGGVNVQAALQGINRRIEILRGREYRLGHAPLMANALESARQMSGWPDDTDGNLRALAEVFRSRIVPLLYEYFHEDFRKIEIALGTRHKRFGTANVPFFDLHDSTPAERELFAEVFDTDGIVLGQPANWWDPKSTTNFDAAAFGAAVTSMA